MNGKKIAGIILLCITSFVLVVELARGTLDLVETLPITIIFMIIGLILLVSKSKKQKEEKLIQNQERNKIKSKEALERGTTLYLKHATGLPLAEGTFCTLTVNLDGFNIAGGGADFKLSKEKITVVDIVSDVDVQKHYVSSAGGAVGGAILFGGLGALVGGRTKEKTSTSITNYLIINFLKDNQINNISFEIPESEYFKATTMKNHFGRAFSNDTKTAIDL
ncbi:hypothetical protein [Scatolibacter rhodanostii]|uniref:hypothetical protein n=1 Tax=Scatolibacter rhodanostii TaxID=2014781 RepID=UPI000C0800C2|nr:hypothetical protein [Scatolibacter rhodanostii]